MTNALGIDGCRGGWVGVFHDGTALQAVVRESLLALLEAFQEVETVFIDMPIGLPGGRIKERACDRAARRLLKGRASSVFSPPARAALQASSHAEASALNQRAIGKGLSIQAWNIVPKIRELDGLLEQHPAWRERVFESHPEICFRALNGDRTLRHRKAEAAGRQERLELLGRGLPEMGETFARWMKETQRSRVKADDLLDATVLWFAASRPQADRCTLPEDASSAELRHAPLLDERGRPMRVVYCLGPHSVPWVR